MTKAEEAIRQVSELNRLVDALNDMGRKAGLHDRPSLYDGKRICEQNLPADSRSCANRAAPRAIVE